MIGEIITGDDFLGLSKYALGGGTAKSATVLVAQGVRWESAEAMAADFEVQRASLRPALHEAVLHVALSWHPSETEKLTDNLMVTLAEEYLEGMGIDPDKVQWALVRHHDQPHPHGHLIVNCVTHDGEAVDCGNNFRKSQDVCRELEARYELVDAAEKGEARIRALVERRALGEDGALRQKVLDAMDNCLRAHPTSVEELATALAKEKVTPHPTYNAQGALQAVVFTHEDHPGKWVKGSALRPQYGGEKLGETLARNAEFAVNPPEVERNPFWSPAQAPASPYQLRNFDYVPSAGEGAVGEEIRPVLTGLSALVDRLERELTTPATPPATAREVEQVGLREQPLALPELLQPRSSELEM